MCFHILNLKLFASLVYSLAPPPSASISSLIYAQGAYSPSFFDARHRAAYGRHVGTHVYHTLQVRPGKTEHTGAGGQAGVGEGGISLFSMHSCSRRNKTIRYISHLHTAFYLSLFFLFYSLPPRA
jgi:hypothetical protein